jgi:hypothetical protein
MWIREPDGTVVVDTAFITAIGRRSIGVIAHQGFGDFALLTPVGKVYFARDDDRPMPSTDGRVKTGRAHVCEGKKAAIEFVLEHAEGC